MSEIDLMQIVSGGALGYIIKTVLEARGKSESTTAQREAQLSEDQLRLIRELKGENRELRDENQELREAISDLKNRVGALEGDRKVDAAEREQLERDNARIRRQRNAYAAELNRIERGESSNPSMTAARVLAEISDADDAASDVGPISYDEHDLAEIADAIAAGEVEEDDS
jgi:predicted RNase H-like nuclease (RuvC/YqgF family)